MASLFQCSVVAVTLVAASLQLSARTVNARLVYFSPSSDDPKEMYAVGPSEDESVTCQPTSSVTSDPVVCPVGGSGKVTFAKSATGNEVLASASVPAGVTQAVFFFLKNPDSTGNGARYQVLVVDESNRALPGGGSYVCNITPKSTRVTIGEFKYELTPGKSVLVNRPKTDPYNMAPFQVQIQNDDGWAPVKDSSMRFAEVERYFMIIFPDRGVRPTVKIYKQPVPNAMPQAR